MGKNKVYYGEYTLKHWVDLILTKDIILPDYQRIFVWDKDKAKALIEALMDNQFVPPVTIGSYSDNGRKTNLILDGQQRLTSILLAYLKLFPPKEKNKIKNQEIYFASENDDDNDDETDFIDWDFRQLLTLIGKNQLRDRIDIHENAIKAGYENLDIQANPEDFENCYLGFSFIVPATDDDKAQQRFYSKVFRSINIEGKTLLPLESRAALYYLNKDLAGLFAPDFAKSIKVKEGKMDFVRNLSMLSQYYKFGGKDKIARGYTKVMEVYYENFIYAVVDEKETKDFPNLSNIISNLDYAQRINKIDIIIKGMGLEKIFDSIIDLDLYMFGIIYHVLFLNKDIPVEKYDELNTKIQTKIAEIKGKSLHVKNPSALKHLHQRIEDSIVICKEFAI